MDVVTALVFLLIGFFIGKFWKHFVVMAKNIKEEYKVQKKYNTYIKEE